MIVFFINVSYHDFFFFVFFFNDTATTEIYTLSLHDALPISPRNSGTRPWLNNWRRAVSPRSEEHTSELQSRFDLVCRLLLEKKKKSTQERLRLTKTNSQRADACTLECD